MSGADAGEAVVAVDRGAGGPGPAIKQDITREDDVNTRTNMPAQGARVRTVLLASLCALAAVLSPLAGPASAATPGSIVAWGLDGAGQVSTTPTGTGFAALAAGWYHGLALRADGSIAAWGHNSSGQVSATPIGIGFTAVAGGAGHSLAVRADGSLVSWGHNEYGQVSATPTGTGFTAVSAGVFHSVALRGDGSLVSWGLDVDGLVSATPAGPGFTAVDAGGFHSVALRADGSLLSWGSDRYSQVSGTPTRAGFTAVAAGEVHSVALRADGSLVSWGFDSEGQVSGTPTGTGFTAIAAGGFYNLALRADGSIAAWGYDSDGQVSATPTGTGFTAVAAGYMHSLALRAPVLRSISVTPVDATVARGATQQFTATGTFDDGTQQDLTGSVTWASSAPAATIDASGLATGRQAGSTTISAASGSVTGSTTLTVTPTNLVVQGPAVSKVFGASVPPLAPSYVGLVLSDVAPATPAMCATTATASSPVGSYPVTCTGAADPNYVIANVAGTLSVSSVALTVQAPSVSKTYGAPLPALSPTYLGLTGGDTAPSTPATCSTSATAGSPVGSYPVTCSGAADANYTIGYTVGALTVTKAELTVQGPALTRPYGGGAPALAPIYLGLVNGDGAPFTPATCTTSATAASPVGSYPVTCAGAADGNYSISYSPGSLVVQGAELIVRAPSVSKGYGQPVPALPPAYVGLVNGATAPATAATCSTAATASSDAGAYAVTCSGAADPNYVIIYAGGTVTVTRASLTVQAPSSSKVYGGAVPALAPAYVGLVNGDTAPDTAATCSTSATPASSAATYPVTCSGAGDGNYDISYASGALTVTRAALTVSADDQTRQAGQPNPALTVSYSGFVLGQALGTSGVSGAPACTTAATPASAPGAYPITCSVGTLSSVNYTFQFDPGTLTVGKAQTALSAQPVGVVRSLLSLNVTMTANLRSLVTGQPVASQTVSFTLGARFCSGTTDVAGNASCTVSIVTALLNLGSYSATYGGSATYLPSSTTGSVTLL